MLERFSAVARSTRTRSVRASVSLSGIPAARAVRAASPSSSSTSSR